MKSNPPSHINPTSAEAAPKAEATESLDVLLDSCSVEVLKMALLILRGQQNDTGRGT